MRYLFVVAAFSLLAGCSTTQTSYEQARSVPASRALAFQGQASGPAGRLLITRDSGLLGGGCYIGIFVNGKLASRLGPGERVSFTVPAGENLVGAGSDPEGSGLCGIDSIPIKEVTSTIKEGDSKRFRVSGEASGSFSIGPSSF